MFPVRTRKVTGPDGVGGERISCSGVGEEKEGEGEKDPFALLDPFLSHMRVCARSFPIASDIHEEYCNHVLEKKKKENEEEKKKKKGANFGHKAPLYAAISRLFEKRPSRESVICMRNIICMREIFKWLYRYFVRLMSACDLHERRNIQLFLT